MKRERLIAAALLFTILGYWVPLTHWNHTVGFDWDLFSGYSLVIRSLLLTFHRLPLHDPWVGGGLDLLSNPQTRIFSPMVLADVLFPPHASDLVTLVVYGFLGFLGMYALLRDRGRSVTASLTCAVMFLHGSWFGLHYVEGHIAYGCMQLFPWILYLSLRLDQPSALFGLVSLFALFILDGGVYATIYGLMIVVGAAAVGLIEPGRALSGGRDERVFRALALLAAGLLVSVKVIPFLLLSSGMGSRADFTQLNLGDLGRILFNPFQSHMDVMTSDTPHRFHEFGCYVSPLALVLIAVNFRSLWRVRENRKLLALVGIFFWLATGWGGIFNPWHLYERIPLLNISHMQSRLFILMDLFLIVLAAAAIDFLRIRTSFRVACAGLLVAEALLVKNYPFYYAHQFEKPVPQISLIPDVGIRGVRLWGAKPDLYFPGDYSYILSYEAAAVPTHVHREGDPDYHGIVYGTRGEGEIRLESFSPGKVEFSFNTRERIKAEINTNYLGGWVPESGAGEVYPSRDGLVDLAVGPGSGKAVIRYHPAYLTWVLFAYAAGLLLWLGLLARILQNREARR
jgi:hypothetical protein